MLAVTQLVGFGAGGGRILGSNLRTAGTNIGNMIDGGGLAAAFDATTNQALTASAHLKSAVTSAYVGKDFGAGTERRIYQVTVYGSNDEGYVRSINPTVTITIRGKQTAPANAADGTSLGSTSFTDTANESGSPRLIDSTDKETAWRYVWAEITHNGAANEMGCAEMTPDEAV